MSVRRTMVQLLAACTCLFLLLSCTAGGSSGGRTEEPEPVSLEAPTRAELADGVRLGDQTDQTFYGVAVRRGTVAPLGYDLSANTQRPLFATSTDAGRTWRRGTVDTKTVPEDVGNAMVRDVVGGEGGFVAVGWREDGRPALWWSDDADDWQMRETDDKIFNTGDWVEEDGVLALGGAGRQGAVDATAWFSADGRDWAEVDLDVADGEGRGLQTLTSGVVDGDRLRVLLLDVPPEGGGVHPLTVPLPPPLQPQM